MGENKRDPWTIFEIVVKGLAGVLIPAVIFIVGTMITTEQRNAELAQRNADRVASFVKHMSSENAKERLLAMKIMQFLAEKGELPAELVHALLNIVEEDQNSEVALAASTVLQQAAVKTDDLAKTVRENIEKLPTRIYVHIRSQGQRNPAREVAKKLEANGYTIPGIERLVDTGPSMNQLRVFRKNEMEEGEQIKAFLNSIGINVQVVDLSQRYETSDVIKPRHFELWFSPDAFN